MEGDQVYMDDFAEECLTLYGDGHSIKSSPSEHTVIWPLSEQGNCPYKVVTERESLEYKKRLQTHYFTVGYDETMSTPMSDLLQQISNLDPVKAKQTCKSKDGWIEKASAWIDRKIKKKGKSFTSHKSFTSDKSTADN